MLSLDEFTVGTLADAKPLSLMLPHGQYDEPVLVGHIDAAPMALFLSGQIAFRYFPSADNDDWRGLIIPNVRVEVDETSLLNPARVDVPQGSVVRQDTRLVVEAKPERSLGGSASITLSESLKDVGKLSIGFGNWQVVIGEGNAKRVLWQRNPKPPKGA
ncbi:hypothetical protein [Rhizobium sp. CCGE 510]|uniref:hypothetical protein n=1 Tax=Rhizobium sp. CCGE 510 TaxID=1132836 RepID=UPI00027B7B7E|nr:hypothetical protein [Rhizobium sp. CCGE 510]EJT04932.1 hypothetical protein RCCGE510_12391 [Rhizobium sp. CCGE 510]